MGKLWALFDVFRKGSALTEPELWRDRAGAANAVVGALAAVVALAAVFGHKLEVSNDDLQAIALGVVAIVGICNKLLHVATTEGAGLPAKSEPDNTTAVPPAVTARTEPAATHDNAVRDGRAPYLQTPIED